MRAWIAAAALFVSASASAAPAVEAPSLEAAYGVAAQTLKAHPVVKTREYWLESYGRRWRLAPDPNPPGSQLMLYLTEGEHVRLAFSVSPWDHQPLPEASFDVDGFPARIDGRAEDGIHVWLGAPGDMIIAEFDAPKAGIYPIYSRWAAGWIGEIVVWKAKKK